MCVQTDCRLCVPHTADPHFSTNTFSGRCLAKRRAGSFNVHYRPSLTCVSVCLHLCSKLAARVACRQLVENRSATLCEPHSKIGKMPHFSDSQAAAAAQTDSNEATQQTHVPDAVSGGGGTTLQWPPLQNTHTHISRGSLVENRREHATTDKKHVGGRRRRTRKCLCRFSSLESLPTRARLAERQAVCL